MKTFLFLVLLPIWLTSALAASDLPPKRQAGPRPDLVLIPAGMEINVRNIGSDHVVRDYRVQMPEGQSFHLLITCAPKLPGAPSCSVPFDSAGRLVVPLMLGGPPYGKAVKTGYVFQPGQPVTGFPLDIKATVEGVTIKLPTSWGYGWHKGEYQLNATVDFANTVYEANEGNNTAGPISFSVSAGPSPAPSHRPGLKPRTLPRR